MRTILIIKGRQQRLMSKQCQIINAYWGYMQYD